MRNYPKPNPALREGLFGRDPLNVPSAKRQAIIDTARTWIGTPYHHQGRSKSAGIDCIGLIVGVAADLGLKFNDYTDYQRFPDGVTLVAELSKQATQTDEPHPGDIVCFKITQLPQHVAILSSKNTIIHAYAPHGVVETHIPVSWAARAYAYFTYNEVKDRGEA